MVWFGLTIGDIKMGCDIHLYKESKINGVWASSDDGWADEYNEGCMDVPYDNRFTDRDYNLFGFLCDGVRRSFEYSLKERGFPNDASKLVSDVNERWGCDGHSHSWLTLSELRSAWEMLQSLKTPVSGMKQKDGLKKLIESIESGSPNYDLLYPYCQSTNIVDYLKFEIEIPASYMLDGVKRLIDLFDDDEDGDLNRVVFWFDN